MLLFAAIDKWMSAQSCISIGGTGVRNDSLIVVVRRITLKEGCSEGAGAHLPHVAGEGHHR